MHFETAEWPSPAVRYAGLVEAVSSGVVAKVNLEDVSGDTYTDSVVALRNTLAKLGRFEVKRGKGEDSSHAFVRLSTRPAKKRKYVRKVKPAVDGVTE